MSFHRFFSFRSPSGLDSEVAHARPFSFCVAGHPEKPSQQLTISSFAAIDGPTTAGPARAFNFAQCGCCPTDAQLVRSQVANSGALAAHGALQSGCARPTLSNPLLGTWLISLPFEFGHANPPLDLAFPYCACPHESLMRSGNIGHFGLQGATSAANREAINCTSPTNVVSDILVDQAVLCCRQEARAARDSQSAAQAAYNQDADAARGFRGDNVAADDG